MFYLTVKRTVDFLFLIILFPIYLPIILLLTVIVYFDMGRPVFFLQNRIGKGGNVFQIIKFRTMLNLYNKEGILLSDENRITRLGSFMRKYSLDELPCLINVFKGEMTLVGPRPFIEKYRSLYNSEQWRRHEVMPGITGLAQVKGRNAISWQEKFRLDLEYIDNQSILLDIKILILTVINVLKARNINEKENVTMHEFTGNETN